MFYRFSMPVKNFGSTFGAVHQNLFNYENYRLLVDAPGYDDFEYFVPE